MKTLEGHSNDIYSLKFNLDSKLIVSGSRDKSVRLWDTLSGK